MSSSTYAPGESPFRVRGSTYLGIREHVDKRLRGGLDALMAHLPSDAHRRFAAQIFLPVGWYDALPIIELTRAVAAVEQAAYADSVRERAVLVAQRDLSGLYKLLLKVVSAELVLERLQRASLRYFDFGRVEVRATGKGRSEGAYREIPAPLAAWFSPMITGYAAEALRAAGASAPRVRFDAPEPDGERFGVPLVALPFAFSWS